jgi:outer membrane murein-binding lipoprotein Lpp
MIVSGRDSGIKMVAFEMMIGMTIMAQTRSQCLSSSGINEEKADQASSESSHDNS